MGNEPSVAGARVVTVHCVGVPDDCADVTELVTGLVRPVSVIVTVAPDGSGDDPA